MKNIKNWINRDFDVTVEKYIEIADQLHAADIIEVKTKMML